MEYKETDHVMNVILINVLGISCKTAQDEHSCPSNVSTAVQVDTSGPSIHHFAVEVVLCLERSRSGIK